MLMVVAFRRKAGIPEFIVERLKVSFVEWGGPMRAAIVCLWVWFLAASSVFGQFTYLSAARRVEAHAGFGLEVLPGQFVDVRDEPVQTSADITPFDQSAVASVSTVLLGVSHMATATAWQDSMLAADEIVATGGLRGLAREPDTISLNVTGFLWGHSLADVTFSVEAPTRVSLWADLVQPPNQVGQLGQDYVISGELSYALVGPGTNIAVALPREWISDNPIPVPAMPRRFTDSTVLIPGTYTLSIAANYLPDSFHYHNPTYRDISYDVHLEMQPIPEPSSWLLAFGALTLPFWKIAKRKRLG
jgi:hypothetical protein